ncbi:MAG: DUF444 family protein, partial [Candidatus Aenigmarchaeota archaeon]|nr:DUF444 family protein [Candidatus Aenigmarchaeota archaeon]
MERGERAEHRYNKKVRDYLTQEEILNQLLEDRSFFVDDGGEPVKVDLSTVELPKLKFKEEEQEGTGQGDGDMEGQGESDGEGSGKGQEGDSPAEGENGDTDSDGDKSEQAHGNKPGYGKEKDESYEDEFTLEDIADFWLDKYGLPKVNDYEGLSGKTIEGDFEELDKTGIRQDLNLRETLKQNIKYNLIKDGHAVVKDIDIKRDGIYDVEDEKKWSALEVYVIDTSPSMNKPRRDLSRLFSFLVSRYLDKKYESNERRFVIFSNTAEECDGDE